MRAVALASACLPWSPCTRVCRLVRTCAFVSWLPYATLVSNCCKQCVSDRSISTASATFPATLDSLQFYMHDKLIRHAHPANCADSPHEAMLIKHENLPPLCLQCHSSATTVLCADAAVVQPVLPWFCHTSTATLSSHRHMVSRGLCDPAKQSGCPAKINLHPPVGIAIVASRLQPKAGCTVLLAQLKPQPPLRFAALASTTGGGCGCRRLRHAASAGSATGWGQDRQRKIHIDSCHQRNRCHQSAGFHQHRQDDRDAGRGTDSCNCLVLALKHRGVLAAGGRPFITLVGSTPAAMMPTANTDTARATSCHCARPFRGCRRKAHAHQCILQPERS
jgi:hypothetical protein